MGGACMQCTHWPGGGCGGEGFRCGGLQATSLPACLCLQPPPPITTLACMCIHGPVHVHSRACACAHVLCVPFFLCVCVCVTALVVLPVCPQLKDKRSGISEVLSLPREGGQVGHCWVGISEVLSLPREGGQVGHC